MRDRLLPRALIAALIAATIGGLLGAVDASAQVGPSGKGPSVGAVVAFKLLPSRKTVSAGEPWTVFGTLENQGNSDIFIVNRFTILSLPIEIVGVDASGQVQRATLSAIFPTAESGPPPAYWYRTIRVAAKQSYTFAWDVNPLELLQRLTSQNVADSPGPNAGARRSRSCASPGRRRSECSAEATAVTGLANGLAWSRERSVVQHAALHLLSAESVRA